MPNHNDEERLTQRLDELEEMIRGEWPDAEILRLPPQEVIEPQGIRVEIARRPGGGRNSVAIIFKTDNPLMSDMDSPAERVFRLGIDKARRIFSAPPNEDRILQGTVIMTSRGINFEPYSGLE
jgi:hypothetical protein